MISKKRMRLTAGMILNNTDDKKREEMSGKITRALCSSALFNGAESIFVYLSTPKEPDTKQIIAQALKQGKKVFVPVCGANGSMTAVEIDESTEYRANRYGIAEPAIKTDTKVKEKTEADFDLCILPCVAASVDCIRLGHGGGYYDRFLENYEGKTVCLCFSPLLFDDIPHESHDILPWAVITDDGTFFRGGEEDRILLDCSPKT